jgi:hypothetical protein
MWRFLRGLVQKRTRVRFHRKIEKALALQKRGEARRDGLELHSTSTRIEVTWWARDIHPWDREYPSTQRTGRFMQQAMEDTDATIVRLFDVLPGVDRIDVRVLQRATEEVMMRGTVNRSSIGRRAASVKMRLMGYGISFSHTGARFEPWEDAAHNETVP